MKHNYFKHLFMALMLLCASVATAYDFKADGFIFNITDSINNTVEIAPKTRPVNYKGDIVIPENVTFENVTYSVTSIGKRAFFRCTELTNIEIPNSVTSIGNEAFYGCTELTSITIPNSVTSIGNEAFYGCTELTNIEIPNSITSFGEGVFYGCTRLNKIEINCATIGSWFSGLSSIEEVVIGNSVTSIGERAFNCCTGLASITIPNSVTSIGENAFYGCTGLASVVIGNSVTSIGENAFYNCTTLKEVHISDLAAWCNINFSDHYSNPLSKARNLYLNGEMITDLVIPEGVADIKASAFSNCTGLTSVTIPNSVTSIGYYAFWGCSGLTSVVIGNSVTSIGMQAFYYCTGLTNIEIPNSVTSIGDLAFSGCTGLTSIEIPNSVTSIGERAFWDCSGLTSIEIPNSVTTIGHYVFRDCTGLTSITIPNSVTSIGRSVFYGCTGLESIVVENGNSVYDSRNNCNAIIETATNELIAGCKNTVIPNSVTSIGEGAFSGCTGLANIEIPNSVTSIGDNAFTGCTGLKSIEIPNSVTSIGNSAFSGCTGLTSVEIGDGVTSIGNSAFNGCTGLTSVEIPNSVTSIGDWAFSGCTGLTSIEIPNSVTSIGSSAFKGCTGLTSIEIPNSVTSIGDRAFYGCTGLTSITIPNSVTSIGEYAFYGCIGLKSITSYIQLENIIYNAPYYLGLKSFDICTIYVPYGTAWAYERDMFCKNVVEMAMTASNLDALYNEVLEYASAIIDDNEFKSHGVISGSTQLSTNAQEKTEGPISNLLDSDIETFFHSSWSSESDPVNGYHYLQVDLGEALDAIEIKYSKRMNNTMKDYNPEYVEVTATNNVNGEWTLIGNYHWDYNFMTDTVEAGHATYVMDNAYRHVRITVKRAIESYAHLTTPPFFNLSEFGVWKSDFDASHPTYSGVPAMLMDELQAAMAEAKEKLSAREHSEATFNRLKKAFEDVVEFKTTGVEEVKSENGKVKTIYDLQGRRVKEASQPGIYIINGKKTLIK